MIKKVLGRLGLNNDEMNIYLFLLRKGESKVTEISKELNLARTSIYRFLEILQNKGFVSYVLKDSVQVFYPLKPEKIVDLVSVIREEVKEIVPELEKINNKGHTPVSVEVFKGVSGVKMVMSDILAVGEDYIGIGEGSIYLDELRIFGLQWVRQISERGIKGKILGKKELLSEVSIAKTEEYKYLPEELVPEIGLYVYGDKTAQFIWSESPYVILIKSEDIASSNRKYFDYLWKYVGFR